MHLHVILLVYLKELREASLADPIDERSSALVEQRCEAERLTILIGTSDLSDEVLGLLRAVPKNLVAMIGAPEDFSHLFNEFGSVVSAKWEKIHVGKTGAEPNVLRYWPRKSQRVQCLLTLQVPLIQVRQVHPSSHIP